MGICNGIGGGSGTLIALFFNTLDPDIGGKEGRLLFGHSLFQDKPTNTI